MATFTQINDFLKGMPEGQHAIADAAGDVIKLSLTNTAPGSEAPDPTVSGNGILANITEIVYTNYTDDLAVDRILTAAGINSTIAGGAGVGVYTFDHDDDIIITAAIGALPTFRYIYLWNDTSATPADQLIGVWDHGSAIDLALGESATIAWNASGIFTIT